MSNAVSLESHTVHQLIARINKWDFSNICKYLSEKCIYPDLPTVEKMRQEYVRYMALCLAYPERQLPISEAVDPFWHTHILYTKNYRDFARYMGQEYIDHMPAIGADIIELREPFDDLCSLYRRHFGELDTKIWNRQCCKGCDCHVKSLVA